MASKKLDFLNKQYTCHFQKVFYLLTSIIMKKDEYNS